MSILIVKDKLSLVSVKLIQVVKFSCLTAEDVNDHTAVVNHYPGIVSSSLHIIGVNSSLLKLKFDLTRK